jgi:hypothetical protein
VFEAEQVCSTANIFWWYQTNHLLREICVRTKCYRDLRYSLDVADEVSAVQVRCGGCSVRYQSGEGVTLEVVSARSVRGGASL